ncbi:hypothetical protein JCM8097_002199 [Rhodosporidiobolus ruineniae]
MAAVAPSKAAIAQQAVAAKPDASSSQEGLMSPSLESVLEAFKAQGGDDKEMLKLLLQAKAKEDERLAALDMLRAEQLRAASSIAMQNYYAQYLNAMQLYTHQANSFKGPPPYSPGSPPPALLSPGMAHSLPAGVKRPRAASDASVSSIASDASSSSSSKKAKTSFPGSSSSYVATEVPRKPSHEDVMAALRRKCGATQPQDHPAAFSPSSASGYFPALAPRISLSPPLPPPAMTTATGRRSSPPHVPGRHTSFLRPAPPPSAPAPPSSPAAIAPRTSPVPPPAAVLATVPEEDAPQNPPAPRNKLALLLHASESTDGAVPPPKWEPPKPKVLVAATSDVRGEA